MNWTIVINVISIIGSIASIIGLVVAILIYRKQQKDENKREKNTYNRTLHEKILGLLNTYTKFIVYKEEEKEQKEDNVKIYCKYRNEFLEKVHETVQYVQHVYKKYDDDIIELIHKLEEKCENDIDAELLDILHILLILEVRLEVGYSIKSKNSDF